jgi:hypothetical protein
MGKLKSPGRCVLLVAKTELDTATEGHVDDLSLRRYDPQLELWKGYFATGDDGTLRTSTIAN